MATTFKEETIDRSSNSAGLQESQQTVAEHREPYFGRISPTECRRRLLHILPGLLPIALWYKFHHDPLSLDCRAWMALIIVGIGIGTAVKYRQIARTGEQSNPACILGYTIPVLLMLMLIPEKAELGLAALAIISFGDGFATVGGLLLRGPTLPWNKHKSWAGFLCFLTFAAPWSAVVYWAESLPAVPFESAFLVGATATGIAAIAESIDTRLDDNIRVGIFAMLGLLIAQTLFLGW